MCERKWSLHDLDAESCLPFDLVPSEEDSLMLIDLLKDRWQTSRWSPKGDLCEFMCSQLQLDRFPLEHDIDEALKRELFRIERLRIILEVHGLTQFEDTLLSAQRVVVNAVRLVKQTNRTAVLFCDDCCLDGFMKKKMHYGDLEPPAKKKRVTSEQREWLQENWHLFEGEACISKQVTQELVEMKRLCTGGGGRKHCVVCLDKERSFCYVPCGHKCVCAACAQHPSCATRCPICKAEGKPMRVFDA